MAPGLPRATRKPLRRVSRPHRGLSWQISWPFRTATLPHPGSSTRRVRERLHPPLASFHLSIPGTSPTRPNSVTGIPLYRKFMWFTGLPNCGRAWVELVHPHDASAGRSRLVLAVPVWRNLRVVLLRGADVRSRVSGGCWGQTAVPPSAHSSRPTRTIGGQRLLVFRRPGFRG